MLTKINFSNHKDNSLQTRAQKKANPQMAKLRMKGSWKRTSTIVIPTAPIKIGKTQYPNTQTLWKNDLFSISEHLFSFSNSLHFSSQELSVQSQNTSSSPNNNKDCSKNCVSIT